MATAPSLASVDVIGPDHYAQNGYPHAEWALLRREAPVHWVDSFVGQPFWAITKHADVCWISRQPTRFLNEPRLAVFEEQEPQDRTLIPRHLLVMDPPVHGQFRRLVSGRFTPRALTKLAASIDDITTGILDEVTTHGERATIDFVERVSSVLPLAAIADILGVPRADWKLLFQWTNEAIGSSDPEYRKPGETPEQTGERARMEVFQYFAALVDARRKSPEDDLISVLVNAKIDGRPLEALDLLQYLNLIVIAGNETTRNATTGGLLALMENPAELAKLRANPELVTPAVEEIVRWVSPVNQFCRTTTEDLELRGQKIRKGQAFCLFYASANRDEDVFAEPNRFRVDRDPNPHIGFGMGEHFCLGANLARLELRTMFKHLIDRLEEVEPAGPLERLRSSFIGGIKRMPIRYKLRAAR